MGRIYDCLIPSGAAGGLTWASYSFWAATSPTAGAVDPAVLAERAVQAMDLTGIDIGITPPPAPDSHTLIGIPTWMWVAAPAANTYGPITRTASAGGVTVTATAKVSTVVWDMGDGARVNCTKGTAYSAGFAAAPSPTCGHSYGRPGTYPVTATALWVVDWDGAGQSGQITFDLASDTTVRVMQASALVESQG